ncbi:ABC transporter E family member 2-like [Raphanus sativus]|uniref:ABC transporter E family member 2-like n=1 Tax=Raphanus sativus TaxID=3726 RepID=A0A9W3BYS5_RAPSA|nr:ABC transporter E family member 2-like [Raphanus sativus]
MNLQESAEEIHWYTRYKYPTMTKTQEIFRLKVTKGKFTYSQIIVMIGENGTGKTIFILMLMLIFSSYRYIAEVLMDDHRK